MAKSFLETIDISNPKFLKEYNGRIIVDNTNNKMYEVKNGKVTEININERYNQWLKNKGIKQGEYGSGGFWQDLSHKQDNFDKKMGLSPANKSAYQTSEGYRYLKSKERTAEAKKLTGNFGMGDNTSTFRARNSGESLGDYLKAKQDAEIKDTGSSSITLGSESNGQEVKKKSILGNNMANTKLPSGILVRDSSNNKIYFIDNGKKRHITSMDALAGGAFVDIDHSHLTNVPDGSPINKKPNFSWKGQADINKLLKQTGINWQKPVGAGANQQNQSTYSPPQQSTPILTTPVTSTNQTSPVSQTDNTQNANTRLDNILKTGNANPGGKPNRAFIDALYLQYQGRKATDNEYNRFKDRTIKDTANIIAGSEIITKQTAPTDITPTPPATTQVDNTSTAPANKTKEQTIQDLKDKVSNGGTLTSTDIANWNYATDNAPVPTSNTTPPVDQSNQNLPGDNSSSTSATTADDKNIYSQGNDLFIKKGNQYYKIPDPTQLYDLVVNQGYNDTRKALPQGADTGKWNDTSKPGTATIGDSAVNHLYKLYLGRDATQNELDMYKNNPDDTVLRKDLEFARTNEENKAKAGQDSGQKSWIGDSIFRGQTTLIKFNEDPDGDGPLNASTIWRVDPTTKNMIPFLSEAAYNATHKKTLEEAMKSGMIKTISTDAIAQGGVFDGYTLLPDKYGIKDDGSFFPQPITLDKTKIQSRYGKPYDERLSREAFKTNIEGFFNVLKNDPNSGVSADIINEVSNDPDTLAIYLNALAYGGYYQNDIYRDLRRKQLIKDGRTDLENVKVIDEGIPADKFYATSEGKSVRSNPDLTPPKYIGDVDTGLLDNVIFRLPDDVYKVLSPPLDWNSPEGQAEIDKIKSAYHDVWLKQVEAKNEREKAIADETYKVLKNEVEKKYNIKLSDNSVDAWKQISQLGQNFQKRGLGDSGLFQEARDKYLQDVRKVDERNRTQQTTQEEENKRQYYLNSASPEEISKLTDEEKTRYGLKPSQEFIDWFSKDNLKKLYPKLSDREIDNYRNSIIDENGDYRSQLYQKLQANKLGIGEKKRTFQIGYVKIDPNTGRVIGGEGLLYKKAIEEEKKYRPFTGGESYSKQGENGTIGSKAIGGTTTGVGQPISDTGEVIGAKKATLFGPNGQKEVVDVGSSRASELQNQGWALTSSGTTTQPPMQQPPPPSATTQKATLFGPSGNKEVVDVGSARASELQSQGWGLSSGGYTQPTTKSTPTYTPPKPPSSTTTAPQYGTQIPETGFLGGYTENQINRHGNNIYLNQGVNPTWGRKIGGPSELSKYTEKQLLRPKGSNNIYTKYGIK